MIIFYWCMDQCNKIYLAHRACVFFYCDNDKETRGLSAAAADEARPVRFVYHVPKDKRWVNFILKLQVIVE